MPDKGKLFAADWYGFNSGEGTRVAVEPERTDTDEVAITVRGLDGEKGPGTVYLSRDNATDLADQLRREVLKKKAGE